MVYITAHQRNGRKLTPADESGYSGSDANKTSCYLPTVSPTMSLQEENSDNNLLEERTVNEYKYSQNPHYLWPDGGSINVT